VDTKSPNNIKEEQDIFSTKHRIQKKFESLLQRATAYFIILSVTTFYYKVLQLYYYKVGQVLLQSAKGITKCDDYYKVRQNAPFCKLIS